jgi:hypothetical protein
MAEKKAGKKLVRTWKTFVINRNRLDEELNKISAEGRTVAHIYPASVQGSYDVLTYTEE